MGVDLFHRLLHRREQPIDCLLPILKIDLRPILVALQCPFSKFQKDSRIELRHFVRKSLERFLHRLLVYCEFFLYHMPEERCKSKKKKKGKNKFHIVLKGFRIFWLWLKILKSFGFFSSDHTDEGKDE